MTQTPDDIDAQIQDIRDALRQQSAELAETPAGAAMGGKASAAARKRVRPKMTATERKHYDELMMLVPETMMAFHWPELAHTLFPEEWKDIPANPKPGKTRITLRVDADVARFFRKLGRGYQERMNDVLRTFMLAKLVDIVGIGQQPVELMMAQDTKQKNALDREAALVRELEELRRKRVGMG